MPRTPDCDYSEEDEEQQQVSLVLPPLCLSVALCAAATSAPIRTWTLTLYSMHLYPPLSWAWTRSRRTRAVRRSILSPRPPSKPSCEGGGYEVDYANGYELDFNDSPLSYVPD